MKRFAIAASLVISVIATSNAANEPTEYQVAVIDAGKYIPPTDTSVSRSKALLQEVSKIYGISQVQAADIAAKAKSLGSGLSMFELLDWSLIACESKCTIDQFRENLALYVAVRGSTPQTHHQAVRGLLILSYVAKTTAGGKRK